MIETSKQGDINADNDDMSMEDLEIASSDPARVRELVRDWAQEHGMEFSEATVSFMTAQIVATAAAMKDDPEERWRDTDDDIGDVDPASSDAAALSFLAGLPPAVGYDLTFVHSTNPNFTGAWWSEIDAAARAELLPRFDGAPPPLAHPGTDSTAGAHASQPPLSRGDDYAVETLVHGAATAADVGGWTNAARNLRHFLGNSGDDLLIDPSDVAGDDETFEVGMENLASDEVAAAVAAARANGQYGVAVEFRSEWAPISFADRDWYLALGDSSYSVTGSVIVPVDPNDPIDVTTQYHLYDYYTWDEGKVTPIGPVTISDEMMQGLHTAGLAQEFDIYGSSQAVTVEVAGDEFPAVPDGGTPTEPSIDAPADDDRDGDRSDPNRPMPRDDGRAPEPQA